MPNDENNDEDSLASEIEPPPNNMIEIEGVDRMGNETEVCRLQPVEYVQVHQEDEPQNTTDIDRTVGAIALGPQYNLQGG